MFLEFSHFRKPWHGNLHRADVCVWICVDHCHKDVTCTVVMESSHGNIGLGVSTRKLPSMFVCGNIGLGVSTRKLPSMFVCGFSRQRCNMHCSLKSNTPRVFHLVVVIVSLEDEHVAPCVGKM